VIPVRAFHSDLCDLGMAKIAIRDSENKFAVSNQSLCLKGQD